MQAPGVVASEVVPDTAHTVEVFGTRYALYKVGDDFFATQDSCPHAGGPLGGGDLDGHKVSCPFHGYEFDVRTGQCSSGQPFEIACVPVRVKSERVLLRVGS
ncbi:MAG TPA: hypothetical protein DIU15_13990 [Deltaproteobacteria bacterium]|nr:hypothetical protein [Deltaproteobacteria bacterium]HCP47149.1 hypothetical protein [Deltaproteobacteria bacterium]